MTRKAHQPYQETVIRRQTSPGLTVLCALVLFLISSQLVLLSKCAAGAVKSCGSDKTSPSPVPVTQRPAISVVAPSSWYIDTGYRQNRCVGSMSPFSEPHANLSDPIKLRQRIGDKFKLPGSKEITFDKHYTVSLKLSEEDVQNHLDTVCTLLKVPGARGFMSYWPGRGGSLRYSNYIGAFDDETLGYISKLTGVYEIRPVLASGDKEGCMSGDKSEDGGVGENSHLFNQIGGHFRRVALWMIP